MIEINNINEPFIKVFVGELEIVGNGIAHVTMDNNLKLVLGTDMEMEFEFSSNKDIKGTQIERRVHADKRLIWNLTNFSNSLGTGVINPIEIGNLNERKLYVSFFIWTPSADEGKRIINYVIYNGEKIEKEDEND